MYGLLCIQHVEVYYICRVKYDTCVMVNCHESGSFHFLLRNAKYYMVNCNVSCFIWSENL
jgi:hypothetical protein